MLAAGALRRSPSGSDGDAQFPAESFGDFPERESSVTQAAAACRSVGFEVAREQIRQWRGRFDLGTGHPGLNGRR